MSTYADLIDDIRMEMVDEAESRWSDAQIMRALAWSVRRLAHVLRRNDIEPGRSITTITTVAGDDTYALPADFMAPYGLYRDANKTSLQQQSEASWAVKDNPLECSMYLKRDTNVLIAGTPTTAENLTLVYWPKPDTTGLTTADTVPWSGNFDDILVQYAALRLKNIDEMDASLDLQLLQDIENNLIATYAQNNPMVVSRRGWCP